MKGIGGAGLIAILVILVIGAVLVLPMMGIEFAVTGQPGVPPTVNCPDTTVLAYSAAKNTLNSSIEYQAGSVIYTNLAGNQIIASDTMTSGSSKTYKSTTIPCTPDTYGNGLIAYAVADASRTSDKKGPLKFGGGATSVTVDFAQPDSDQLTGVMYDTALTNTSTPSTGTKGTPSETTAVAMSAGDSRSGYVDFWEATGKSQYGSDHDGILWCIDTVNSAAFTDNSIALNSQTAGFSLTPIDCNTYPKSTSVDSCNICYKSRAIKATDSRIRIAWTMNNDGGSDAGASDDPLLYIEDLVYFEDTDGVVKLGTHDSAGTNKGETQVKLTWANS